MVVTRASYKKAASRSPTSRSIRRKSLLGRDSAQAPMLPGSRAGRGRAVATPSKNAKAAGRPRKATRSSSNGPRRPGGYVTPPGKYLQYTRTPSQQLEDELQQSMRNRQSPSQQLQHEIQESTKPRAVNRASSRLRSPNVSPQGTPQRPRDSPKPPTSPVTRMPQSTHTPMRSHSPGSQLRRDRSASQPLAQGLSAAGSRASSSPRYRAGSEKSDHPPDEFPEPHDENRYEGHKRIKELEKALADCREHDHGGEEQLEKLKSEHARLKEKVEDLEQQIGILSLEKDELQEMLDGPDPLLEYLQYANLQLSIEMDRMREDLELARNNNAEAEPLEEKDTEIAELKETIRKKEDEIDVFQEQLGVQISLGRDSPKLRANSDYTPDEYERLQHRLDEQQHIVNRLESELELYRDWATGESEGNEDLIVRLTQAMNEALGAKVVPNALQERIDELKSRLYGGDGEILDEEDKEDQTAELKERMAVLQQRNIRLERDLSDCEEHRKRCGRRNEDEDAAGMAEVTAGLQREIEGLSEQLATCEASNRDLHRTIARSKASDSSLSNVELLPEIEEYKRTIRALDYEKSTRTHDDDADLLAGKDDEIRRLQNQLADSQKKKAGNHTSDAEAIADVEKTIRDLESQLGECRDHGEKLEDKVGDLDYDLKDAENEILRLRRQLRHLQGGEQLLDDDEEIAGLGDEGNGELNGGEDTGGGRDAAYGEDDGEAVEEDQGEDPDGEDGEDPDGEDGDQYQNDNNGGGGDLGDAINITPGRVSLGEEDKSMDEPAVRTPEGKRRLRPTTREKKHDYSEVKRRKTGGTSGNK